MVRKASTHGMSRWFFTLTAMCIVTTMLAVSPVMAEETAGQRNFTSPQQAVDGLVGAVRDNDDAELLAILGPGSDDLISSGDRIADRNGRARFLEAHGEKSSLEQEGEGSVVLLVGNRDYPFPIPIVRHGETWIFDTQAGLEEILNRRIGGNELHTIEVMRAYTDAQREYASLKHHGGVPRFAQKFAGSEGAKDGLYWEAGEGEEESPFGPLIARATGEGYEGGLEREPAEPFHGYYFKILKGQGKHANGGVFDYVVEGKMILGFGLVAYPARYGVSGVMTFMVNQEGVIYEKDLGEETATVAAAMTVFDPDDTWRRYEEEPEGR